MPNQRYKPEQIVNLLRKIEVENANGSRRLSLISLRFLTDTA